MTMSGSWHVLGKDDQIHIRLIGIMRPCMLEGRLVRTVWYNIYQQDASSYWLYVSYKLYGI